MLSAMRYGALFLGTEHVIEPYLDSSSALEWVQNTRVARSPRLNRPNNLASAREPSIGGSFSRPAVYGIFLSFGEFGPGCNLGLLASKSSPTAVRGQFYGTAAAIGKVGAFVGTWAFKPIINDFGGPSSVKGNTGPFYVGSGLAVLSAIVTYFFIHPVTADGMEKEDREFREYLEANGYDTSAMGFVEDATIVEDTVADEKKSASVDGNV
ncbi:hypothetical protein C0991_010574 [Blastosporella zonata]|nr:hypothetical protein C0991_010574 [Blastosporella zonata]